MIFFNEIEKVGGDMGNILLKIGDGCVSNCYNCNVCKKDIRYYNYNDFYDTINFISKNCDNKLHLFFYGPEAISSSEIEKFLNDNRLKKFQKSVHIAPLFSAKRLDKMFYLYKNFPELSFDTCYVIKNNNDLKLFLLFLKNIIENNIKSTLDIFFDFGKYFKFVALFLKKYNYFISYKSINTHIGNKKCIEYQFNNSNQVILFYDLKCQKVFNNNITNLSNNFCIAKKCLEINEDKIEVSEEIEFTKNGDITIHLNSYCSVGINKISSIYKNKNEIIKDFVSLKKNLNKYDSKDMGKNCFECMNKPYSIN